MSAGSSAVIPIHVEVLHFVEKLKGKGWLNIRLLRYDYLLCQRY